MTAPDLSKTGIPQPEADPAVPSPEALRPFSSDMQALAAHCKQSGQVVIGDLPRFFGERLWIGFVILCALPFCTPVPTMGLSAPFGALIGVIGACWVIGKTPFIPSFLQKRSVPAGFIPSLLMGSSKLVSQIERLVKPRMLFMVGSTLARSLIGLMVLISAVLLMLPLPVPFSNMLPALTIVLAGFALLCKDGLCLLASAGVFLGTQIFFGILAFLAWKTGEMIIDKAG